MISYIRHIDNIITIICTLLIAFNFKRLKSFGRIIFILFLGNSIADTLALILIKIYNEHSQPIYYVWFQFMVFLLFWLYEKTPGPLFGKPLLKFYIPIGVALSIIGIYQDRIGQSVYWPMNVSTLFLFVFSYFMLRQLLSEGKFDMQNPMHMVIVAYTLFCGLNIQSYAGAFYFYMKKNMELMPIFKSLNIIGYAASSIIMCYAILRNPKYELP